jgi:hypothetical protein
MQLGVSTFRWLPPLIVVVAVLFSAGNFYIGFMSDSKLFLFLSARMLEGGGIYTRWFEVNPPLVLFVDAIPALAAKYLPIPPAQALAGYALLLSLWSTWMCRKILRASSLDETRQRLLLTGIVMMVFILPEAVFVFADREHVLMLLAFPWLLQMLLGVKPSWKLAAVAAVGFCLKPYNLVIPALMLLFGNRPGTWRQRVFSPSAWAIAAVALAYGITLVTCFPEYFAEMKDNSIAYSHIRLPVGARLFFLVSRISIIGAFLLAGGLSASYHRRAWLAFIAGMTFAYMCGGGWTYTQYMLYCPLLLIAICALMPNSEKKIRRQKKIIGSALCVLVVLVVWSAVMLGGNFQQKKYAGEGLDFSKLSLPLYNTLREQAGDRFILLSLSIWSTRIASIYGPPQPAFGYINLWMLPLFLDRPDDARVKQFHDKVSIRLAQALESKPSPTVIVDASPHDNVLPLYFDKLAYLRKDARVDKAFAGYRLVNIIDGCEKGMPPQWQEKCRFEIWKPQ